MAEINFDCPHCAQNLDAPDDLAGSVIDCPACGQEIIVPGTIIEEISAPPPIRPSVSAPPPPPTTTQHDAKGKTVRIELPPEFLEEPPKHVFKIKRIQR